MNPEIEVLMARARVLRAESVLAAAQAEVFETRAMEMLAQIAFAGAEPLESKPAAAPESPACTHPEEERKYWGTMGSPTGKFMCRLCGFVGSGNPPKD